MEAYNQLPPAVQAMILEQQTSAREKEFESQVGAPAAPGSLRGGSRQDFQRRMAAAKQDRADVQETFDREEADEVKRLAKVKEAEAAAKRAAKEAEDAHADAELPSTTADAPVAAPTAKEAPEVPSYIKEFFKLVDQEQLKEEDEGRKRKKTKKAMSARTPVTTGGAALELQGTK